MRDGDAAARVKALAEAAGTAACLFVFAGLRRGGTAPLFVSSAALLGAVFIIVGSLRRSGSPRNLLGLSGWSGLATGWSAIALAVGAGLGIACRGSYGHGAWPLSLTAFAFVAASIGATEELVYRGYLQGRLALLDTPVAVAASAVAHTAYKFALFVSPPAGAGVNFPFLLLATLLVGLALGWVRHAARSVVPAIAFHVAFDIVVYGDRLQAPWWVWG